MAEAAKQQAQVTRQGRATTATSPQPRVNVDIVRILAYTFMTIGAFIFIVPFLWMLSVSIMSLGETQRGALVTNQALIEVFTYTDAELEVVLGDLEESQLPSFIRSVDLPLSTEESRMTAREFAKERNAYWQVDNNTILRGGVVNYIRAWDTANFGRYFFNSVVMTFLTVSGQTLFSILAAYSFARIQFPGRDLLFGMFLATLFIPPTITLIPNYLTVVGLNNAFNSFWQQVGLTDLAASLGLRWIDGWFGLVVPFLASTFGIFLLRQFFRQIPDELYDAARIDGAGHLRFLFQVVVPIARAAIITVMLFTFIGTWNALDWPILVTQSKDWRPISYGLYAFQSDAGTELNLLMAGAVISLVPILIMYFIAQKQFTEGIATTGLKG